MRPLMIWLFVFALFACLAMIKIGVYVCYIEKSLQVDLTISKWKVRLVGEPKKIKKGKAKAKKNKSPSRKVPKKTEAEAVPKKKGAWKPWVSAVLSYWRELFSLIGRILRTPTLDVLRFHIQVGGGDVDVCAVQYGRVCAIVSTVLPVLENTFRVNKRDIQISCDFDRSGMDIAAESAITIRIYEIFALAFALIGLGIKILLQARNNKKAVQNV